MNDMTLISMNKYVIEVNDFKYEIIWQHMQGKISDMFAVQTGISTPGKPCLRPMGEVPSGRKFLTEPHTFSSFNVQQGKNACHVRISFNIHAEIIL
jgi:hypothetical protein